ncbi:NAD+ synthase [Elusimicrobiota bacterium]
MRIALVQLNFTVGDVSGNLAKINDAQEKASANGADIVLLPELSLLGYPLKDVLLDTSIIQEQARALQSLAKRCKKTALVVGWAQPNKGSGKPLYNCVSFLHKGKVRATHRKMLLPFYDVFDEGRYFEPGNSITTVSFNGFKIALSICEDIWNDKNYWEKQNYEVDPLEALGKKGADILLNSSASPYMSGKREIRANMIGLIAKKYKTPVFYSNLVGGNDELIFDGSSIACDANGKLIMQGPPFKEAITFIDIERSSGGNVKITKKEQIVSERYPTSFMLQSACDSREGEAYHALVTGTRDYIRKCGFSKVVLGLSGGIDSSLVAAIASDALGPSNVLGISLPSRFSSRGSLDDAKEMAASLGINYQVISIEPIFNAYLKLFEEIFKGLAPNIAEENIQARIRGAILMAVSNKLGHVVLAAGNKSELACGYCTLYGDLMGGLAPISDLSKGWVYRLCAFRNKFKTVIPRNVFRKAPSAELAPNQKDEDSLPAYSLLDDILEAFIVEGKSREWLAKKFPKEAVHKTIRLVYASEFKRRQAPPGLKVTKKAFGSGRRMPIACKL